jgi:hypothetical protein
MNKFVTLLLFILLTKTGFSQYYFYNNKYYSTPWTYEFGGGPSAFNALTDVGGNKGTGKLFIKDLNLPFTKLGGNIQFGANYEDKYTFRFDMSFGKLIGEDAIMKKKEPPKTGRYNRNLNFRTNIFEFAAGIEAHPVWIFQMFNYDNPPRMSPYVYAGVGFFSFNPQTRLNGRWVDLAPLKTEGQGFKEYPDRFSYKLRQFNLPLGLGLRYEASEVFSFKVEGIYRILFTDYLDDVSKNYIDPSLFPNYLSGGKLTNALTLHDRRNEIDPAFVAVPGQQRGNPKNNDAFLSLNFKVIFNLGRDRRF